MSHGSSPLGPSSTSASSSFAQHITTNASASSSSSAYHVAPGGPSSRPAKRVKVEHTNSQDGRIGASSVSGSGSGSMGRVGERARSYSMREEEEEEREPEYVGDPANLEQYRKEAIYLSLLSSKRHTFRTQKRVKELENQLKGLQSGVIVVEKVWGDVMRLLEGAAAGSSRADEGKEVELPSIIESLKDPTLQAQLESRLPSLQNLLSRLFPTSTSTPTLTNFSLSATLESALESLRIERDELVQKYESVVLELDGVKHKCDRWKLEYERMQRGEETAGEQGRGTRLGEVKEEDIAKKGEGATGESSGEGQRLLKEEGDKAAMEDRIAGTNGNHHAETNGQILTAANDHENLLTRLKSKDLEIDRLSEEKTRLQSEMDFLKEVAWNPTEDAVTASAMFKALKAEFEEQRTDADEAKRLGEVAEKRADELVGNQEGFKAAMEYSYNQKFESLDRLIRAKDADIARLRGQRDAIREENDMLKGEKQVVFNSIKETDEMVTSAEERLKAVQSELKRLRSRSAAEAGEQSYLGFLLEKSGQELDYVRSLENKITEAGDRERALQEQIKSYMRDRDTPNITGLMRAEGRAREEAEKYKRMYQEREAAAKNGPNSTLLEQVAEKSKEIDRLAGMLEEREAATMTLYSEVENLSKAYEQMERTATKKVYDLKSLENQALEAMTVKAKAEHKYFAECRKSAALLDQQQAITKTLEAQRVALDKSRKVEDDLRSQLAGQEKEIIALKNKHLLASKQVQRLETDVVRYKSEAEESSHRAEGREKINSDRLEELKLAQAENRSLKTEIEETKHKLKQSQSMLKSTQGKGVSVGEVALQKERDMLFGILRCTACHLRFKTKILAPCLHTFCDECITARLTNRNRKCITCMKPFAESDVKNLF